MKDRYDTFFDRMAGRMSELDPLAAARFDEWRGQPEEYESSKRIAAAWIRIRALLRAGRAPTDADVQSLVYWAASKRTPHDDVAVALLREMATNVEDEVSEWLQMLFDSGNQMDVWAWRAVWLGRWQTNGCPELSLDERTLAAFSLTTVSAADLRGIWIPWNAWRIPIPDNLIYHQDGNAVREVLVHYVAGQELEHAWLRVALVTKDGAGTALSTSSVAAEMKDDQAALQTFADALQKTDLGGAGRAVGNIVLCSVLALTGGWRRTSEKARRKKQRGGWNRSGVAPKTDRFVLSKPVKVRHDLRRHLREMTDPRSTREQQQRKVQWLRRGHPRWQAYGPGYSMHRLIWIEPTWCGPVDAPIVRRPHELSTAGGSP